MCHKNYGPKACTDTGNRFRALKKVDPKIAAETFEKYKDFYHPICLGLVEKDLAK